MARRRGHNLTWVLAACGGVLAAVALVLLLWHRFGSVEEKSAAAGDRAAPPGTGAYASGGRPTADLPVLDRLFGKDLPGYVIALDAWARSRREGHDGDDEALAASRGAVSASDAMAALGEAANAALTTVLERAREVALAPASEVDRAADGLGRAVLALDDQLAAAGLGYLVDSDVMEYPDGRRLVLLFSFSVEHVAIYHTATGNVRVLRLRRLDQLNWTYTLLGFTSPRRREALILVEQVDERLVDRVLPQLGSEPPPFYILDEADRQLDWYPRIAARATRVVRAEYGPRVVGASSAQQLGELLARRKNLFAKWERFLSPRGITLATPSTLRLEWDYREELEELISAQDLGVLAEIESGLASEEVAVGFARAREILIASVERHEIQHRIDNTHPDPLPMPAPLEEFVGPLTDPGGETRESAQHAVAELSAYLSELARDSDTGGMNLTILAQFAIAPPHWGTAECYAALVIFEELAGELDVAGRQPLVEAHTVDRERVTDTYLALTEVPPEELRDAAKRLWERLFGRPLATIEKL